MGQQPAVLRAIDAAGTLEAKALWLRSLSLPGCGDADPLNHWSTKQYNERCHQTDLEQQAVRASVAGGAYGGRSLMAGKT
jgi:hypothetical protein